MEYKALTREQWLICESETGKYRHLTAGYCDGVGIDIGSQGVPVVPWAMNVDLPMIEFDRYCNYEISKGPVQLRCGAQRLPIESNSLDFVYSSHLLEDFQDWTPLLAEWVRVLKGGGRLVILMPDKQRWLEAMARGQQGNPFHQHEAAVGEISKYADSLGLDVIEDRLTDCWPDDYTIIFAATKTKESSLIMDAMIQKWRPVLNECRQETFTWTGDEFCWVAEAVQKVSVVVEIGIYMGWSSLAMLKANPQLSIVGVDSFHTEGSEFVARKVLKPYLDSGRYSIIKKKTIDAIPDLGSLRGKVDLVFIDGDHDYDSVATDIRIAWPLLKHGGVVFGHDYVPDNAVGKAFKDLLPHVTSPWPLICTAIKEHEL
jgi:predicted O-methyltransferase YrrM